MRNSALYDIVRIEDNKVFIIDLDLPGTRSVTNDAEYVYSEVQKMFPGKRVIYRDTMGRWDEIVCGPLGSGPHAIKFFNVFFSPYNEAVPSIVE